MDNIIFQVEKLSSVKEEVFPLLLKHWDEIALNKETVPLDPDWEMYQLLEDGGAICITTARKDGRIIGYFAYIIIHNLHYRSLKVAEGDIFYVDKEYRKGGFARKLLRESEKNLKALGVNKILNKVKKHFKNPRGIGAGLLFEYTGYVEIESLYAKMV